jgi:hypothetical protein
MLKEVHEHLLSELQQSSRTDTIFVVAAVVFNLVVLGINTGVAASSGRSDQIHTLSNDLILSVLIAATILINLFVIRALLTGSSTREKILNGLVTMYRDNNVDKYYDQSLLRSYGLRYKLFVAVVSILAVIAIFVPLISRLLS